MLTKYLKAMMMDCTKAHTCLACLFVLTLLHRPACAEDWPTYQHDIRRSAVTEEMVDPGGLVAGWVYESSVRPQTAWSGPAKWDAYRNMSGLRSMRDYDSAFHAIVAGEKLYFSSSADDSIHCLNAVNGEEEWSYCTDGPVRIAPTYSDGKIYAGSDDGYAYCLNADDGALVWKHKPSPSERLVPHNGKLISQWPCRSGVLVDDGMAYFACSLLPWENAYLCAVDADTGSSGVSGSFQRENSRITMEGALVASDSMLYVPQGRRAPRLCRRTNGTSLGSLGGGGGVFVLLSPDRRVYHAPGNKTGWVTESNADSRDLVATFDRGNRLVVSGNTAYILHDDMLIAIDRSTRQSRWNIDCRYPHSLILAGGLLFAGGNGEVAAFRASDGTKVWDHSVDGKAHGLTLANGGLFVSTHTGKIHAFRHTTRIDYDKWIGATMRIPETVPERPSSVH